MLGGRGVKWCVTPPLFLEPSPCYPCHSGPHSEMSKSLCLLFAPSFKLLVLCCTCMGCLFCCLFKGGVSLTSWSQGFPRAKLADFENSRSSSPAVFQNSQNLVLLFFKGKYDEDLSSMFVSIPV